MDAHAIKDFNLDDLDPTLYRQDFYAAVNDRWAARTPLPADHTTIGGDTDLVDHIEHLLRHDFADLLAGKVEPDNPEMAEFKRFYALVRDFDRREKDGTAPLKPLLARIERLKSFADYNTQLADWYREDQVAPVDLYLDADMAHTSQYALYLDAPQLILPDKPYYEPDNPDGPQLMAVYTTTVTKLLVLCGYTKEAATQHVARAKQFDALLVPHVKSSEDLADDVKRYNPRPLTTVLDQVSALDLKATLKSLLGSLPEQVILPQPAYVDALNVLLTPDNFTLLRSWLLVRTVYNARTTLSEDFRHVGSAYQLALSGQKEAFSRDKAALYLATGCFDQVVGDYYGRTYFGEQAKADVRQMVINLAQVYSHRLAHNDWLSAATREKAILKLQKLSIKVGYPDKIHPRYAKLIVDPKQSVFANVQAFNRSLTTDEFAHWGQPVDTSRWYMSANEVNAYYDPQHNEIVFPAGILQAPFYDLSQSTSANYGGIGAVIGHEISHAFDNNGAHFDENGNLHNWWTPADLTHFEHLSQAMIDQFNGLPFAGKTVNGKLTVSENIADAGGLSCALEAAKAANDVDLQAFFITYANSWRMKATTEYMQVLLAIDVHAPEKLRTNVPIKNLSDFYTAFDVQPGDAMYLAPADRVNIW